MGYAVISATGKSEIRLLCVDVLKLGQLKTAPAKLKQIYQSVARLIEMYAPSEVALEAPFFGKNVQSMLKLGRAQGMAMAPAVLKEIPIFEYSPKSVKQAITGNGNASKEQVAAMLKHQVDINFDFKFLDATDALATAICHLHHEEKMGSTKSYGSWKDFVKSNPDKLKE